MTPLMFAIVRVFLLVGADVSGSGILVQQVNSSTYSLPFSSLVETFLVTAGVFGCVGQTVDSSSRTGFLQPGR